MKSDKIVNSLTSVADMIEEIAGELGLPIRLARAEIPNGWVEDSPDGWCFFEVVRIKRNSIRGEVEIPGFRVGRWEWTSATRTEPEHCFDVQEAEVATAQDAALRFVLLWVRLRAESALTHIAERECAADDVVCYGG